MSDDLDKLKAAMQTDTPDVDEAAQDAAIMAGMEAFEKNFQGSADGARPSEEQSQFWELISRGAIDMLKSLTSRQALMATASVATIAVAVVLTGQYSGPTDINGDVFAVSELEVDTLTREVTPITAEEIAVPEFEMADTSVMALPTPRMEAAKIGATSGLPSTSASGFHAGSDTPELFQQNTEQFPDADVNALKVTAEEPVSTFSIDVDTASYAYVRSALLGGYLPPEDAVRTEEMINYFAYDYPVPQRGDVPFTTSVTVMETPWNADTKLLHIGIKGYELPVADRPPVNLVFLVDTSGSMQDPNKLPLLVNSFRLMLSNLQADDKVAIVTYAGSAGTVLEPTAASDSAKILASLENLYAGGSSAGQAGLHQAYALAEQMADGNDATSRVILATDGDFNVGISEPEALKEYVEDKRDTGVYLSVLGFGRGNYNDALMQTLAQNGNGTAAYIDTLAEAQKVLVDQIGGALFTIAQDVKIQVEFNPAEIAEYRLIGYETRALNREDFNNDAVDAGEIGAGHSVTAIYEITPVGSPAVRVDDLRYGSESAPVESNGEYAFLKLRYKNPGEDNSHLITTPVLPDADAGLGSEAQFAAAVAGFGQILRGDTMLNGWDIEAARGLAETHKGADTYGYRAELITLMRLAQSLK